MSYGAGTVIGGGPVVGGGLAYTGIAGYGLALLTTFTLVAGFVLLRLAALRRRCASGGGPARER